MPSPTTFLLWITSYPLGGYLLVLALNLLVTLIEIITVFEPEAWRALRTWGALLLLLGNALAGMLVFDLIRSVVPETPTLPLAFTVGVGLAALIRTRLTLFRPLPQAGHSEARSLEIPLDVLYDRWQGFCRRRIDRALAVQRIQLIRQALEQLSEEDFLAELRLLADGGFIVTQMPGGDEAFFEKVTALPAERRKTYLAFTLLDLAGQPTLKRLMQRQRARAEKREQESKGAGEQG
jgi:hypothetical protein